jgi:hypothetical protein
VDLEADVAFNAAQVVTTNLGDTRWTDVTIAIARDDTAAYLYRGDIILGRRALTIGALNFARADGARFSPFEGAPRVWAVTATLPDGHRAYAAGRVRDIAIR